MQQTIRNAVIAAAAGLSLAAVLGVVVGVTLRLELPLAMTLAVLVAAVGVCLLPLAWIVYRAGAAAGPGCLVRGTFWGAMWGVTLGALYWWWCGSSFPLWHIVVPVVILAACGLINTALDVHCRNQHDATHQAHS